MIRMKLIAIFILVLYSLFMQAMIMIPDTAISYQNDSITKNPGHDSLSNGEQQEADFQKYIDTIYHDNKYSGIDTFAWDNKMINSGHFNSMDMKDSIYIVLVDSSKQLYYVPPFKNVVTFGFGPRSWSWHFGVDIRLKRGDSIHAAFDGIVRVTKYDRRGFGNVVVIRHPSGLETIYGHLSKVLVKSDQKVKAGELIGLGGSSGRSTGTHLHFETRYLGEPFDPDYFIDFNSYQLKRDTLILSRNNFEYLIELRKAKFCSIRKGDTLYLIARRYHTTVNSLCRLNNISPKTILRIGRQIRYQ